MTNQGSVGLTVRDAVGTSSDVSGAARSFYVPSLDIVRFVAFSMVFFTHAMAQVDVTRVPQSLRPLAAYYNCAVDAGGYGVDLFFVLSSFLITRLLLIEKKTYGRLDIRRFYWRRLLRIWPLYYGFLICNLLVQTLSGRDVPSAYLSFLIFTGNFALASGVPVDPTLRILWSLCVEEQFYLVWPLVAASLSRHKLAGIAVLSIVTSVLVRLGMALSGVDRPGIIYTTFSHLDPLAFGILIALRTPPRLPASAVAGLAAALPFVTMLPRLNPVFGTAVEYALVGLISAAIVAQATRCNADLKALPIAVLAYLGKISFGLYMLHGVVIHLTFSVWQTHGAPLHLARCCVAFGLTILCAILSYEFFEKPFLHLKERFARIQSRPA